MDFTTYHGLGVLMVVIVKTIKYLNLIRKLTHWYV